MLIIVWRVCKSFSFSCAFPINRCLAYAFISAKLKAIQYKNVCGLFMYAWVHLFVSKGFKPLVVSSRNCSVPSEDKDLLLRSVWLSEECWAVENIRIFNSSADLWNLLFLTMDLHVTCSDNPFTVFLMMIKWAYCPPVSNNCLLSLC